MNAKIKTFARDHLITSEYTECGSQECHKYEFDEIELEKFAELIVRECVNIVENCDGDVDYARYLMQKHFGIE